ncbi:MAG: ribonuclease HI family protein [Bdellovibrionota bacterium]
MKQSTPKAESLVIHCDGASRGNPGEAGAGAILRTPEGGVVGHVSKYLGRKTNNEAEYTALILALEAAGGAGARQVLVRCDSELMVRQMNGQYKVKHPGLKPLFEKAKALAGGFSRFTIEHVRREYNGDADTLANRAIDERL